MKSFEHISLHTERLVIRPLQKRDAQDLFTVFSDPEVMRHWSSKPWTSLDQAHEKISLDREALKTGESVILGIQRKQDNLLIGTCSLFEINEQCRRAEIGYILRSDTWGQGLMNEALHRLVDFGFSELNLNRIEADIDPRNLASAKSLLRLGFTKEGYLRERWIVEGVVSDTELYGLLHREWGAGE